MFKSYPVETVIIVPAPRREQIATLIGNLSRTVEILTADIEHEEACRCSRPFRPDLSGAGAEPQNTHG